MRHFSRKGLSWCLGIETSQRKDGLKVSKTALGLAALAAAGIACAPLAHADTGDQASAEEAVRAVYSRITCGSPPMPMSLQSITWSRFYPASFGEGRIIDADPRLGGPFQVAFTNPRVGPAQDSPPFRAYGQWGVNLEFC
jgi:hypothetical protein